MILFKFAILIWRTWIPGSGRSDRG
jgi:hypothetical protein